jgi:hypothetical protein
MIVDDDRSIYDIASFSGSFERRFRQHERILVWLCGNHVPDIREEHVIDVPMR